MSEQTGFLIEKNIPTELPAQRGDYAATVTKMEVGDSVLVPDRKTARGLEQAMRQEYRKARYGTWTIDPHQSVKGVTKLRKQGRQGEIGDGFRIWLLKKWEEDNDV